MNRYDNKTKKKVHASIKECLKVGMKYKDIAQHLKDIAQHLKDMGVTTPSGGTPCQAFVSNQVNTKAFKGETTYKRKYTKRKVALENIATQPTGIESFIQTVLTAKFLVAAQKRDILTLLVK